MSTTEIVFYVCILAFEGLVAGAIFMALGRQIVGRDNWATTEQPRPWAALQRRDGEVEAALERLRERERRRRA